MMAGLPQSIYFQCRETFGKCSEFESNESLSAVFVTGELRPFRRSLPQAANVSDRVDACIAYLADQQLVDGRQALPMFIGVLRQRRDPQIALYQELDALYNAISTALIDEEGSGVEQLPGTTFSAAGIGRRRSTSRASIIRQDYRPDIGEQMFGDVLYRDASQLGDPGHHRSEQLEYLVWMEEFIEDELFKAAGNKRDKRFVSLSMKLADPKAADPDAEFGDLSLALVSGDANIEEPLVTNLFELQKKLLEYPNLILLGPPGSGKTTVLFHLTLRLIREFRNGLSNLLPLFFPLTEFGSHDLPQKPKTMLDFLRKYLSQVLGNRHFIIENFHALAAQGRFVFIFDGIDRLPERLSVTARLDRVHRVDSHLRRTERIRTITRTLGLKSLDSRLIQQEHIVSEQLAPAIDPRETAMANLALLSASPVIASCRSNDFLGFSEWQQIEVQAMNKTQILDFVTVFAPEAKAIVLQQWESSSATRSLVSNPFYLRMLTRAVERYRQPDGTVSNEFIQALSERGQMLSFLIKQAIYREVNHVRAEAEMILDRLGKLAYFMLEYNFLGAVPPGSVSSQLGQESDKILKIAADVGLIEWRMGPPPRFEFRHQLYLETLLAVHLKEQSQHQEAFKEALILLGHKGDRWAETLKLMFEMVSKPEERSELVQKFVKALENPDTWDISTRVLSDIGAGYGISAQVVLLLDPARANDLARRGAATILGKVRAKEAAYQLADLANDRAWQVRRSAVEALVAMKEIELLENFQYDTQPMVLRSLLQGRLLLDDDPVGLVSAELEQYPNATGEQIIWAFYDSFAELLPRVSLQDMITLLRRLMSHPASEVRTLGFLICSRTPENIIRELKSELLAGALEDEDATINYIARGTVGPLLTANDLRTIQEKAAKLSRFGQGDKEEQAGARRAYWIIVDTREQVSTRSYFGSLSSKQPAELQLLAHRLAERGDSVALSILTFLLGSSSTVFIAFNALMKKDQIGSRYLLLSLEDPSSDVRLGAAKILMHCHLPWKQGKRVRQILRSHKLRTHSIQPAISIRSAADPEFAEFVGNSAAAGTSLIGFMKLIEGAALWVTNRIFGFGLPLNYWLGFSYFTLPYYSAISTVDKPDFNSYSLSQIEKYAFAEDPLRPPDALYLLTRGRLLRATGRLEEAEEAIRLSIGLDSSSVGARVEQAYVLREQGKFREAQFLLEAENGRFIASSSEIKRLHELLAMDQSLQLSSAESLRVEWIRQLIGLGQYTAALGALLLLSQTGQAVPDDYFYLLYQCYAGTGCSRRALAAAVENNSRQAAEPLVSNLELESLKRMHRYDYVAPQTSGKIVMLVDLQRDDEALALLRAEELFPLAGEQIQDRQLDSLYELHDNAQQAIVELLRRVNDEEFQPIQAALGLKQDMVWVQSGETGSGQDLM